MDNGTGIIHRDFVIYEQLFLEYEMWILGSRYRHQSPEYDLKRPPAFISRQVMVGDIQLMFLHLQKEINEAMNVYLDSR